jgi:hypothetical protein
MPDKYTFKLERDDGPSVTMESQEAGIFALIENFEDFLKGCGFVFDGAKIDLIEDEFSENNDG